LRLVRKGASFARTKMANRTNISELLVGQHGVLRAPAIVSSCILRLLEMGMTEGATIQLIRRGPMGGPLLVVVRGTRLCLRRREAACFPVKPLPS